MLVSEVMLLVASFQLLGVKLLSLFDNNLLHIIFVLAASSQLLSHRKQFGLNLSLFLVVDELKVRRLGQWLWCFL